MKREKVQDGIFAVFVIILTLIAVISVFAPRIFGLHSWEGVIRSGAFFTLKRGLLFLAIVIVSVVIILTIINLPKITWRKLLKANVSVQIRLKRRRKVYPLFTLKPSEEKLELTVGEKDKISILGGRNRKLRWALLIAAGVVAVAMFSRALPLRAQWFEKYNLVAHAGGTSPSGHTYSNSLEAFEHNYEQGHRVFEGDLCLTSDGILVLEHDWGRYYIKIGVENTGKPVTYAEFMLSKFYGTETPMDITSLIDVMIKYPDMYFMTDFKNGHDENSVKSGFRQIVQAAENAGRIDVLDRFIIQNHNNLFKHWVDSIYEFKNYVYTWYSIGVVEDRLPENMAKYCDSEGIPVITMWHYMPDDTWFEYTHKYNLKIFIHTVNDIDYAKDWLASGVAGIYTDDIKPGQINFPR